MTDVDSHRSGQAEEWLSLVSVDAFPADGKYLADARGWQVLVVKTDQGYFAVNDRCSHQAWRLSKGRIRHGNIMCSLHGARFDAASGTCIGGAYGALRTFPLRVCEGMIEVAVPHHAPTIEDMPSFTDEPAG